MEENFCHLVNVTNIILLSTTVNYIPNIDCTSPTKFLLCESFNKTFRNIQVLPIYRKIVEILNTTLYTRLECNNNKIINKSMFRGFKSSLLKLDYINIYDIFILIIFVIIFNIIITYYKKNKKNKIY